MGEIAQLPCESGSHRSNVTNVNILSKRKFFLRNMNFQDGFSSDPIRCFHLRRKHGIF
jgi:hypothetical protein